MTGPAAGVTGLDAADGAPGPALLVAVTVHVYVTPSINPESVIGLAPLVALTGVPPPTGVQVSVYDVMALPPLFAGGVNVTVIRASPEVIPPIVGGPGGDPAPPAARTAKACDATADV